MYRHHVKPLRNKYIYQSKEKAINGLKELLTKSDDIKPEDGEIVTSRYISSNENGELCVRSIIGIYSINNNVLEVTIINNMDDEEKRTVRWKEL